MAYPTYIPAYNNGLALPTTYPTQPFYQPVAQPTQNTFVQPQNTQGLSATSRLVTSKEEAMGVPADFMGGLMVFPDVTHSKIYTKRWNAQTGAADFMEFCPVVVDCSTAPATEQTKQYALAEELEQVKASYEELRDEIETLKKRKGAKKNDDDEQP